MISAQKVKGSNPFGRTKNFTIIVHMMKLIFKSNNIVEISWIKHILKSHKIVFFVLDESMSMVEGNISAIPIRILVEKNEVHKAKKLIQREQENLKNI